MGKKRVDLRHYITYCMSE